MRLIKSLIWNGHVSPKKASERNDNNTFQITQELEFDKDNTLIIAENGAGKSIIGMILLSPFMTEKEEIDGKSLNILANPYPGNRGKLPTIIMEEYEKDAGQGRVTIGLVLSKENEDDNTFGLARYGFISTIPITELKTLPLDEDGNAIFFRSVIDKLKDLKKNNKSKFDYWSKGSEFRKALRTEGFNAVVQNYNIGINGKGEGNIAGYFKKQNSSAKLIEEILVDAVAKKNSVDIASQANEYFGFRKSNNESINKIRTYEKLQTELKPVLESENEAGRISRDLNQAYGEQKGLQKGLEEKIKESSLKIDELQSEREQKEKEAKKLADLGLMQDYLTAVQDLDEHRKAKEAKENERNAAQNEIADNTRLKYIYQLAELQADVNVKKRDRLDVENKLKVLKEKHSKDEQEQEANMLGGELRSYWEKEKHQLEGTKISLDKQIREKSSAIKQMQQEIQEKTNEKNQLEGTRKVYVENENKYERDLQDKLGKLPSEFQDWQPNLDGLIDDTEGLNAEAKKNTETASEAVKTLEKEIAAENAKLKELNDSLTQLNYKRRDCQREIDNLQNQLNELAERRNSLAEIQKRLGFDLSKYDIEPTQNAIEAKLNKQQSTISTYQGQIKEIDEEVENLKSGLNLSKEAKEFLQEKIGEDQYYAGEDFLTKVGEEKAENLKRNLPAISASIVMEKETIDKLADGKITPDKLPVNFPIVAKDDALNLAETTGDNEISYVSGEGGLKFYSYADPELQTEEGREKRKQQLEEAKSELEERISQLKNSIESLRKTSYAVAAIKHISEEFEANLNEQLTKNQLQFERNNKDCETVTQELNQIESALEDKEKKLTETKKQLEKAMETEKTVAEIIKVNESLKQIQEALTKLNNDTKDLNEQIKQEKTELTSIENELAKNKEESEAVKNQLKDANAKVVSYSKYDPSAITDSDNLKEMHEVFESKLQTLEESLDKKYVEETGLEQRRDEKIHAWNKAVEQLNYTQESFKEAKDNNQLLDISEDDINEKINSLGGDQNFNNRKAADERNRIDDEIRKLSEQSGSLSNGIQSLEQKIKKDDRTLRGLKKKIDALNWQIDEKEVNMSQDYKADAQRAKNAAEKAKENAMKEENKRTALESRKNKLGEAKGNVLSVAPEVNYDDLNELTKLVDDIIKRIGDAQKSYGRLNQQIADQLQSIQSRFDQSNPEEAVLIDQFTIVQRSGDLRAKFANIHNLADKAGRFLKEQKTIIAQANSRRNDVVETLAQKAKMLVDELNNIAKGSKVRTENGIKNLMEIKNLPEPDEITRQSIEGLLDRCYDAYLQNETFNAEKEDQKKWLESQLGWKAIYQNIVNSSADRTIQIRIKLLGEDQNTFSSWEHWQKETSGGQETTAAFVVLFTIVHYLAKTEGQNNTMIENSEFLVLDNPFAKVQSANLISTIYTLAKAAKIQLICFTNIKMEAIMNVSNRTYNFKAVTTEEGVKTGDNTRAFDIIKDDDEKSLEAITAFEKVEEMSLF